MGERPDDNDRHTAGEAFDPFEDAYAWPGGAEVISLPAEPDWPKPIPFSQSRLPTFPVEALPGPWGTFCAALATETQTPVDLPAMLFLGVLATAAQGKYRVRAWGNWYEPLCLWPVVALPPGNRKSQVLSTLLVPVFEHQQALRERAAPAREEALAQRKSLATALTTARKRAAKPGADDQALHAVVELGERLEAVPEPAALPVLLASDATPEALAQLLAQQGRITLASAEGHEVFAIAAGRYSDGPNYDLLLKAHAGDTHTVHRVSRPAVHIPRALASLVLAIQPDVLSGLNPRMRGRGMLGRFMYALPHSPLGSRTIEPEPVPETLAERYRDGVHALLELPGERRPDGAWDARLIELSHEARRVLQDWAHEIEGRLGPDGDLAEHTDWAGKLVGATIRIAGLLHVATICALGEAPEAHRVGGNNAERAVDIARYLIPHALAAFERMGVHSQRISAALRVLGWIQRRGEAVFAERDLHRSLCRSLRRQDQQEALDELAGRDFVRPVVEPPRPGPGRMPSPRWEVHPAVLGNLR